MSAVKVYDSRVSGVSMGKGMCRIGVASRCGGYQITSSRSSHELTRLHKVLRGDSTGDVDVSKEEIVEFANALLTMVGEE